MKTTAICLIGIIILATVALAGWTPFMPVWDTVNWEWPFEGEGVYTDSLGNCIILSAGLKASDTLFVDAFVYNRELGKFDTFEAILKHRLTSFYSATICCPYYFHNLIKMNGEVLLPIVIPPNYVYYITFDGSDFTPHYLPLSTEPDAICQLSIFAQMRERGILTIAVTPAPTLYSCCSTFVFPDISNPDSIISIWPTLSSFFNVEGFAYHGGCVYLIYRDFLSGIGYLSRFEDDSEVVISNVSSEPRFFSQKDLTIYNYYSEGYVIIDSLGNADTITNDEDLSGHRDSRFILSRDGNSPLGWMQLFTDDSVWAIVWMSDSGLVIDTTNLDISISWPFCGIAETTPGTIYGVSTPTVYPTSVLGFFAYHDTIVSGIDENPPSSKPKAFEISAHPNPFNSAVTITIDMPVGAIHELPLQIEIYDVNGRCVRTLRPSATSLEKGGTDIAPLNKGGQGGSYIWTPSPSLPSGVYLVRAGMGGSGGRTGESVVKRVVYLK